MPALPPVRARAQARSGLRTAAGPARRRAVALAGVLALVLASAPLRAQTTPPETPEGAPADAPEDAAPAAAPAAPASEPADQPASAKAPASAPADAPADRSAEAPAAAVAPGSEVGKLSTKRSLAWIAIGAAAAFATTSAVLALAVESREQDIEFLIDFRAPGIDVPSRYGGQARDRYEELTDEAETLSTYSWITLGLAGAAVATATVLFVLDDPSTEEEAAEEAAEAPTSGRSHLAPTLLPGGIGVTLDWEF